MFLDWFGCWGHSWSTEICCTQKNCYAGKWQTREADSIAGALFRSLAASSVSLTNILASCFVKQTGEHGHPILNPFLNCVSGNVLNKWILGDFWIVSLVIILTRESQNEWEWDSQNEWECLKLKSYLLRRELMQKVKVHRNQKDTKFTEGSCWSACWGHTKYNTRCN